MHRGGYRTKAYDTITKRKDTLRINLQVPTLWEAFIQGEFGSYLDGNVLILEKMGCDSKKLFSKNHLKS